MSLFSNYTISNFVLTRPRVLYSEKHQASKLIKKPSSIGLINILVLKKVNSRGSLKDWLALIQDKKLVLLLNLPSFFSGILHSTKTGTEDCRRKCFSASKWCCLLQIVDTKFPVNTVIQLQFFDSLLGLTLRRAYTYSFCYHMNSSTWFLLLFYFPQIQAAPGNDAGQVSDVGCSRYSCSCILMKFLSMNHTLF